MKSRNLELDRLRAFAVLMTLNIHLMRAFFPWNMFQPYRTDGTVDNIINNSWTGVDLFLVISGYIISKTIVRQLDFFKGASSMQAVLVKAFYIRRIFRIYPVAWTVFILVVALSVFFNEIGYFGSLTSNLEAGISIFTYTYNYFAFGSCTSHACPLAPYWSLSLEEQFYLVMPFFLLLVRSTKRRVAVLAGLLLAMTFIVRPVLHQDELTFFIHNRGDGLLYGCLLYFLTEQPWFQAIRLRAAGNRTVTGALTLVMVAVLAGIPGIGFSASLAIPVACLLSSLLVLIASCESGFISFAKPIEAVLDYLGARSYSLYLIHMPMLTVAQEIMFRHEKALHEAIGSQLWPQYLALAAALSLAATELVYRLIEQPMLAKGRSLSERLIHAGREPVRGDAPAQGAPALEAKASA